MMTVEELKHLLEMYANEVSVTVSIDTYHTRSAHDIVRVEEDSDGDISFVIDR
jgi:hypothetical protein